MSTSSIATLIQAAEVKFGKVIDVQNNIFLIQREKGLSCAPLDRYMTIEGGMIDGNPQFHCGDYDMSLSSAAENFALRAKLTDQLDLIKAKEKELVTKTKEDTLDDFLAFFDTYLDDEITEGAALSDLVTSDNLDIVKAAFLNGEKAEVS